MSTKMNFGPEWMRSVPTSSKPSSQGIGTIDKAQDSAGGTRPLPYSDQLPEDNPFQYSYERMLELFRPQEITEDFVVSEHVYSSECLPPVCLSELSTREEELLSGSQQQQQQQQQAARQQSSGQYYSRSGSSHKLSESSSNLAGGSRSRARDSSIRDRNPAINGEREDSGDIDYNATGDPSTIGSLEGLDDDDGEGNLWATQSIVRDSVGSFGADGVFRMGGSEGDALEGPSLRESSRTMALKSNSTFSSRAGSPGATLARSATGGIGGSKSSSASAEPDFLSGRRGSSFTTDDSWSWRDPGNKMSSAMQQRGLLEQAEKIKWWYRDPQGNIQGPFSAAHMQEWYSGGYFPSDLQVCYEGSSNLESLGSLVARSGNPDKVFVCTALASIAQLRQVLSGTSTPATPSAISRSGSTVHLFGSHGGDSAPAMREGTAEAQQALASASSNSNDAAGKNAWSSRAASSAQSPASESRQVEVGVISPQSSTPAAVGAPSSSSDSAQSQAVQLAMLLNEQFLLVSAIRDSQQSTLKLQEDLQQGLTKLMQDVAQETNNLHYKAQLANVPVQADVMFALQQQAHATEERLRNEYAQCVQAQAAQIAHLEAKLDPVIRDMVLRSGAIYALEFIRQQLDKLSLQMAAETQQQQQQQQQQQPQQDQQQGALADQPAAQPPTDKAGEAVDEAPVPAELTATASDVAIVAPATAATAAAVAETEPASKPASASGAEAIGAELQKISLDDGGKESPVNEPSKPAEKPESTGPVAKHAPAKYAEKSSTTSSMPNKQGKLVKEQSVNAHTASVSPDEDSSAVAAAAAAVQSPGPSPAPWSTGLAAKSSKPKKSLLQIQQEEEEAMKKRQQIEGQQRAKTMVSRGFGTSYADRLSSGGSIGGGSAAGAGSLTPRSLASIMEEQYKESALSRTPVATPTSAKPDVSVASTQVPSPTTPAWGSAAATASKSTAIRAQQDMSAAKAVSSSLGPALPSMEFLEWCYTRLSSLRGIDISKFIEMLLTFPLQAQESTIEIITEQIYAYSTTLNGRAFAEDFAKRRRSDHSAVKQGKLKSAPVNWAQLLSSSKPAAGAKGFAGGRHGYGDASSFTSASSGSGGDSSFQVVGKKGRR
ncbi:kinesin-like protein [Dipsacomyces acuminosporus]|nr:kinesin-like protein [Dipsacomyces acuminosporus]